MAQRVVYLSWPAEEIAGGIKLTFRHVEILREAGLDAVVATQGAKPPGWFQTTAPLVDISGLAPGSDILVFPENHHQLLKSFEAWGNPKTIFCQNQYMVHCGLDGQASYATFGVSGILCEGRAIADFCRLRFPALPQFIVPVCINHRVFELPTQKKLQIAYAPRKLPTEAAFLRDLCHAVYPEFRSIPWVEIANMSEDEVAAVLKESAVYLSLARLESYCMSILEAFACGCITAGFTGGGARVFTTLRNGFWAEENDCIGCAEQLRQAVRLVIERGPRYMDMIEAGRWTADQHGNEMLARRLVPFWRAFLDKGCFPTEL